MKDAAETLTAPHLEHMAAQSSNIVGIQFVESWAMLVGLCIIYFEVNTIHINMPLLLTWGKKAGIS